jgi:protein involved in polysaccharide export with SLBB domain
VLIQGEVFHPGTYGIEEGEKLSSVLRRAGLFRPTAYPAGAVLEREQVKEMDKRSRDSLIRRIESSQPTVRGSNAGEQAAFTTAFLQQQRQILARLRSQEPIGRMVINISPDVEKWENGPSDVELRAGDKLFIPKRPGFVLLSGQVNNESAITYVPGKSASWYLSRAGGATDYGNKGKTFIIRADGSVIGHGSSGGFFSGGVLGTVMRPGDTIIVPEKIVGPPWWKSLIEVGQFSSSLAVAAKVLLQ